MTEPCVNCLRGLKRSWLFKTRPLDGDTNLINKEENYDLYETSDCRTGHSGRFCSRMPDTFRRLHLLMHAAKRIMTCGLPAPAVTGGAGITIIIAPCFGKRLPVLVFLEFVVPAAHFKEAVYGNGGILTDRPYFIQYGIKAIGLFFSGRPEKFKAGGCSRRYLRRNFKMQEMVNRYCYCLFNSHREIIA